MENKDFIPDHYLIEPEDDFDQDAWEDHQQELEDLAMEERD